MKKIILPTDFSDNSWRAMCYAAELYHEKPCEFHIINTFTIPYSESEVGVMTSIDPLKEASEKLLGKILKQFKELDHHLLSEFKVKSVCGPLTNSLIHMEESFDEEVLILLGTRGISGIGELFFGTTAANVIKHVNSPVICVPNSAHLSTPKKIMLSVDEVGITRRSEIEPLLALAEIWGSEIAIVNVGNNKELIVEESRERIIINHYLSAIKRTFHFIPGEYKEDKIVHFAKTNNINLITLINRDRGFWRNFFHTSLTKNMAFYADIPLLILRDSIK